VRSSTVERILARCDPDLQVVVQDEEMPGNLIDNPAVLAGAAGVALVLLAAATPARPHWFRALLLA
jgi:hypothetical protein